MMQYTQDYDERYPNVHYDSNPGWAYVIYPYVKSEQIYQCPSESKGPPTGATLLDRSFVADPGFSDYFYNKGLTTYNSTLNIGQGRNIAALSFASLTLMNGDHASSGAYATMPYFVSATQNGESCYGIIGTDGTGDCAYMALDPTASKRHLEGANYAFADGHAKWLKPTQIYGAATPFDVSKNSATFHAAD